MKHFSYIIFICCFVSLKSFSQFSFTTIDTLLAKNFEAVNLKDSVFYLSLLDKSAIYQNKKLKTHNDSISSLKPFSLAFFDMIHELTDFAGNSEMEVRVESYQSHNTNYYDKKLVGKILLDVNLVINNTFTVTVPFVIMANKGVYSIQQPMMVMFKDK